MSYMGLPRFSFAGSFYTDPSTMDNDPSHYNDDCTNPSPWQDPGGSHFFSFQDLLPQDPAGPQPPQRAWTPPIVTGALDEDGNAVLTDPLIGCPLNSMDTPGGISGGPFSPAKMVDLDVYQQAVSAIHGFFPKLTLKGISGEITLVGAMDPSVLNSGRFDRVLPTRGWAPWDSYGAGSFGGDTNGSGVFQSIVRIPASKWPPNSGSPVLDQLRTKCSTDAAGNLLLSMRMTLDGYQNVSYHSEDFRIGRIVATVGPLLAGDPSQCVAGRWLVGRPYFGGSKNLGFQDADPWNQPSLYSAPFVVSQWTSGPVVSIDLSNAIMTVEPGESPLDLGNLSVYIGNGSTGVVGAAFQVNDVFYSLGGGIVDLPLSQAQAAAAAAAPFFIASSRTDIKGLSTFNGQPVLWQESPTGTWVACNDRHIQLATDGPSPPTAISNVYVTQWGAPVTSAADFAWDVFPCMKSNGAATVPWSAGYAGNSSSSIGMLLASVAPGPISGQFQFTVQAKGDPGGRTAELDSQLYFVAVWPASGTPPSPNLNPNYPPQEQLFSVVLWQSYTLNTKPQFSEVAQIMKVYDKLFPAMHAKMDLTDQQTLFTFCANPPWQPYYGGTPGPMTVTLPNGGTISAGAIPYYMTRDIEDPRFMPIMRNLSPNKLLTVLYYCWNLQQEGHTTNPPTGYGQAPGPDLPVSIPPNIKGGGQ